MQERDSNTAFTGPSIRTRSVLLIACIFAVLSISLVPVETCRADTCPEPSFAAARAFGVGSNPFSIEVGDFNHDGKRDVVVAYLRSENISVLLGNGDGTFQPSVNYPAGADIQSMAMSDLNADGAPDLVVACLGSSTNRTSPYIQVFLGSTNGTFRTLTNYSVRTPFSSVAVGDFNRDGKPDVALASSGVPTNNSGAVSILLGNGDGTFAAAVDYSAGIIPFEIHVGDFNGDGKADLLVANRGSGNTYTYTNSSVSLLLGNGDGTVQNAIANAVGLNLRFLAVGDLNGDGKLDFVGGRQDGGTDISVFLGNGDGTFQAGTNFPGGSRGGPPVLEDFNGDGKIDLIRAHQLLGTISVLLGKGNGTFDPEVSYAAGHSPVFVAVGEFNGDGKSDLAVANLNHTNVTVLLGNGDGSFIAARGFPAGHTPSYAAVGDLNGDGKLDLVASVDLRSPTISVLFGNGDGNFQPPVTYPGGAAALGDFNGDGSPDLAVGISFNISVLINKGDGTFRVPVDYRIGFEAYGMLVRDFNQDGWSDVAVFDQNSVSVLLGNGDGTFQAAVQSTYSAGGLWIMAAGDFNADGIPDLVLTNPVGYQTTTVSIRFGNGDGTFRDPVEYISGTYPSAAAVGDFNGDGKDDLAVANRGAYDANTTAFTNANVSVLLGNGDGTFRPPVNYQAGARPRGVAVSDVNQDGKPDLIVANWDSGDISFLLGNGDGTFQGPINYMAGANPFFLAMGDFNRDGKPDVAVTFESTITGFPRGVSVLLNTCGGAVPALSIARTNSLLNISWPLPAPGFVLESVSSLNVTNWQPTSEVATTNNNRLEVTVPINQQARYFRLRKP